MRRDIHHPNRTSRLQPEAMPSECLPPRRGRWARLVRARMRGKTMEFKPKFQAVAPITLEWKLVSRDLRAALLRNAGERREYFCVRRKNILQTAEVFPSGHLILGYRRAQYLTYSRRLIVRGYCSRKFTAKHRSAVLAEPPSGREVASATPAFGAQMTEGSIAAQCVATLQS